MTLREQFDAMDLATIEGYLGVQEENLHLDFKLVDGSQFARSDDKRNFAQVLSGFANSDGGLCVWGVDARQQGKDGPDVVQQVMPLPDCRSALSRLNELTGSAVNPLVDGVLHKAIPTAGDAGVIVTLVPASEAGPHMAKLGEDRYYKRSGDSFRRMEHFDIEDMFGRRAKPVLSLEYRVRPVGSHPMGPAKYLAVLSIHNSGRAAAIGPFLSLSAHRPYRIYEYGLDGNGRKGLPQVVHVASGWTAYGGAADVLVYPGIPLEVVQLEITPDARGEYVDARVDYVVAAANARMIEKTLTIPVSVLPT